MMNNTINGRTPEEIRKGQSFSEYLDEALGKVKMDMPEEVNPKEHTLEDVKKGLEACAYGGRCSKCPYMDECDEHIASGGDERPADVILLDALFYIQELVHERDELLQKNQQLERERDAAVEAAKAKPFTWEEAIQDDCFLEIKDDEYIDAALNIFASSHDEFDEEDHISYLTNDTPEDEILILYRGDYNRKWRCWPRRPTDEERAAAKWEVE